MLIGEETVALGAVMAAVAVVAGLIVDHAELRARLRYALIGLGSGAVVAIVILAIPLYYQFFGPLSMRAGVTPPNEPLDLLSLVRPSMLQYYARDSDIAANQHFLANGVENTGYIGVPLLILLAVIVVWLARRRDRFAIWWLLTFLGAIVLSAGTRLWVNGKATRIGLPWYALKKLPLFDSVVTVRFSVVTTLLIALALAYALAQLPRGRFYVGGLIVVALALFTLRPNPVGTYTEIDPIATPHFFTTSAVDVIEPGSTVVLMPNGEGPFAAQYSMYWQIQAKMRFKIVGGYGVFNIGGVGSYIAPLPAPAAVLVAAETTGYRSDGRPDRSRAGGATDQRRSGTW